MADPFQPGGCRDVGDRYVSDDHGVAQPSPTWAQGAGPMRVTPLLPSDLQSTTGGAASVSSTPITGATATASACAIRGAVEEVYEMNASFGSSSSAAAD